MSYDIDFDRGRFQALTQWGTDFNIISKLFPNRTRRQIKAKYNKEDRARRWKVSEAIMVNRKTPGNYPQSSPLMFPPLLVCVPSSEESLI